MELVIKMKKNTKTINNKKDIEKNVKGEKSEYDIIPDENYVYPDFYEINIPFTINSERYGMLDNYHTILAKVSKKYKEEEKIIDPLNDFLIKKALLSEGCEDTFLTVLNLIFEDIGCPKIKSIEFTDKGIMASIYGHKDVELDVKVKTDNNILIDLEVQLKKHKAMDKRFALYEKELIGINAECGDAYEDIPNIIQILLLKVNINPLENFHNVVFKTYYNTNVLYTKSYRTHVIELKKFIDNPEKIDLNNQLHRILLSLVHNTSKELMKILLKDPVVNIMNQRMVTSLKDPKEYLEWVREQMKDMETAQLVRDGREEEKFQFVKNLLKNGVSLENISKYTGLSIKQIEKFKDQNNF